MNRICFYRHFSHFKIFGHLRRSLRIPTAPDIRRIIPVIPAEIFFTAAVIRIKIPRTKTKNGTANAKTVPETDIFLSFEPKR